MSSAYAVTASATIGAAVPPRGVAAVAPPSAPTADLAAENAALVQANTRLHDQTKA